MSSKSRQEIREEENLLNCRQTETHLDNCYSPPWTKDSGFYFSYCWPLHMNSPFPIHVFLLAQVFTQTMSFYIISNLSSSNELNPTLSQGLTNFRQLLQETVLTIAWFYICKWTLGPTQTCAKFGYFWYDDHYYNSQHKLFLQWTDWLYCTLQSVWSVTCNSNSFPLIKKYFIKSCHSQV